MSEPYKTEEDGEPLLSAHPGTVLSESEMAYQRMKATCTCGEENTIKAPFDRVVVLCTCGRPIEFTSWQPGGIIS